MLMSLKQFGRLCQIYYILARYRIDTIVLKHHYFYSLRLISLLNPFQFLSSKKSLPRGEAIRLALETLGPVFVKFGQTLSTRRDLLPEDIADELAKLQDNVPPFPGEEAKALLESVYRKPINTVFTQFDLVPLASASIAQVHAAELPSGKAVVIKILRPHIEKQIKRDIALMYLLSKIASRYFKKIRRFKAREIVAEFENAILGELDLLREAANASQLRRQFLHSSMLYIPEIYWEYTHHSVIVMERIYGIPIRNVSALQTAGIDVKKLAERGIEIFFTQVFRDSFFHADMHPGNIFVSYTNPHEPQYIAVDFGIMGSLNETDKRYIAENFLAFFKRDYKRVALLHIESGWAPSHTRIDELEAAIRTVCEPIFEKPLAEISFGQLLLRLFQMASRFEIEIQPQLILLQKTLLNIEGLGRYLYPQLDLWKTAKPFLERWIKTQIGPRAFLRKMREYGPLWLEKLPEWPNLIDISLQRLKQPAATAQNNSHVNYAAACVFHRRSQKKSFLAGFITALALLLVTSIVVYTLKK